MKIRNLIITAACVLLAGNLAYAQEDGITLTQVGTIDDPNGEIMQEDDGVIYRNTGNSGELCAFDGTPTGISGQWHAEELVDGQPGLYVVMVPGTELAKCGLMKADGTMLIEPGPAIIKMMDDSSRFVRVMYGEEKTTNEYEAIFYSTAELFSFGPSTEDTMYKGYWKIYDLQEEQFVEPLSFDSLATDVRVCGDETIWTQRGRKDAVLYDVDGTVISDAVKASPEGAYFITSQNNMEIVCNSRMEQLFESDFDDLSSDTDLAGYIEFRDYDNDKNGLMDAEGNIVLEADYLIYNVTASGNLRAGKKNADGNNLYGVVKLDGTEVVPFEYDSVYEHSNGYLECERTKDDGTEEMIFVGPNDTVSSAFGGSHASASDLLFTKEDSAGVLAYVVNDGDYTLELNSPRALYSTMAVDQDPISEKYALYDLVTGEQLLGYEYETIFTGYGYVYAYKDGVCTIYQIG